MSAFYTVAAYDTHLAYGGPEEGGWWYDAGAPVPQFATLTRVFKAVDGDYPEDAIRYCQRLNRALRVLGKLRGERDYTSVLADGNLAARIEPGYPAPFPVRRPRYE